MKNPDEILDIPFEETLFINPDLRVKLFTEIYTKYQKMYGLKLLYAYLNYDASVPIDYVIIFKGRNAADTGDLIVYDIQPIHAARSTPGYRYCKRNKITDDFFKEGVSTMTVMEPMKFYEFITHELRLSRVKKDENYWKSAKNGSVLLKGLMDLSLRYVKLVPK